MLLAIIPASPSIAMFTPNDVFAAIVLGGFDRIGGTVVAAIAIAIAQQLATGYVSPSYAEAYPFLILLVALILKPEGLIRGTTSVRY